MFEEIVARHRAGEISSAQMAALGFVAMGAHFNPKDFIQDASFRSEPIKLLNLSEDGLANFFMTAKFKQIRSKVPIALGHWLLGKWPLVLLFNVPSVYEVLCLQAEGKRCVTLFTDPTQWESPKLTKDNALHFLVHDLEHAHQFFHQFHDEQVQLNKRLRVLYDQGYFEILQQSPVQDRVDYLLSDMNTHPAHAERYLEAIWYDFAKTKRCDEIEAYVVEKMRQLQS